MCACHTRVTSMAVTAAMVDRSSRPAARHGFMVPSALRPAGGARDGLRRGQSRECDARTSAMVPGVPSILQVAYMCPRRGCSVGARRSVVSLAQIPPCAEAGPGAPSSALSWRRRRNQTRNPRRLSNLNTITMPGKNLPEIANEPCRRCKENSAALVVRTEPLCR